LKMVLRVAPLLAFALGLAGCSVTESLNDLTKIEYRTTAKTAPLDIPPNMVSPRRDERFVLPGQSGAASTTYSAYARERSAERQPGAATDVLPAVAGVRMERQGAQRWLVVDLPPERVWPVVRSFWIESGFVLRIDSPETGVLETEWAENRPAVPDSWLRNRLASALGSLYSTGERDRFRTRLESDGKGTEIFVSHRGLGEELVGAQKESTVWVQRPSDPELEAEFLRRLMLRLSPRGEAVAAAPGSAGTPARPAAAAAAAPAAAMQRASLIDADGRARLKLQEGFERAWRQVGLALDRSGFTVEDRDRSKGTYFVRYVDLDQEVKSPGFLGRMFGGGDKRDLSGKRYRILVAADGDGSRVEVLDEQGGAPANDADRRVAGQIAALLQEQLK
jgi:outer membrane protein assembly factor BamC